ncbi:hypothetical protein Tco_0245997 [Tanacetum coccineum]
MILENVNNNVGELVEPGASIRRHTGSYYPKRYWELLPKEILGAITQRDTGSYYPKRDWDVLWENRDYKLIEQELSLLELEMGRNGVFSLGTSLDPSWSELELHLSGDKFLRCDLNEWGVWLFIGLEITLVAKKTWRGVQGL